MEAIRDILDAAHYAAQKHAGQKRKGRNAEPYVNHLIEVAHLVSTATAEQDTNLVIAALLHDVIEDTDVTAMEVAVRFGQDVAGLVVEMTDDNDSHQRALTDGGSGEILDLNVHVEVR